MRDIKFRVWDDTYKYMNYKVLVGMWGENVFDDENYSACSEYVYPENVDYKCEPHWTHFEPYMKDIYLMQYTGLHDKNGKEIYEGDILKINFNIHKIEGYLYLSLTEEEREQRYYLTAVSIPDFYREPLSDDYEVIGNIYENKELLDND